MVGDTCRVNDDRGELVPVFKFLSMKNDVPGVHVLPREIRAERVTDDMVVPKLVAVNNWRETTGGGGNGPPGE